jgi:probable rRNA maturation factor
MDPEPDSAIEEDSCQPADEGFHIEFFFDDLDSADAPVGLAPEQLQQLRAAIRATLVAEQVAQAEVSVAMVSGPRMRELNRQYLQHDYDTDVLSFCLEQADDFGFLLGQLIVSVDYARQQSQQLSSAAGHEVSLLQELALYLVHGTLHLVGYDDQEPADQTLMRQRELACLEPLGLTPVWLTDSADQALESGARPMLDPQDRRETQA